MNNGLPGRPRFKRAAMFAAAALSLLAGRAVAAEAEFSKDCQKVYVAYGTNGGHLQEIDLATGKARELAPNFTGLDAELTGPDAAIMGISLAEGGKLLCATQHAIWSWDPGSGRSEKICDAPEKVVLVDVAYDPASGDILAEGVEADYVNPGAPPEEATAYYKLKKGKRLENVKARYGTNVGHALFANDGTLFFTNRGDLWTGFVMNDNNDADDPALELDAYRCAPFAFLEEEDTTPPSTGLTDIAVTKSYVYARYARMYGSGWGSVIRFRRPGPFARDEDGQRSLPSVDVTEMKWLAGISATVEKLEESPCYYLCAARDRDLVFMVMPGTENTRLTAYLIKGAGKPVKVKIDGL